MVTVKLTGVLSQISRRKVLVAGDFMLDTYTIGKARRISPEAPVAVVNVQREEHRAGGSGNVVLNLVSLGAEVVAVGRIGHDAPGVLLKKMLKEEGVDVRGLITQEGYPTPLKNRILAENQQIVRVDHECVTEIPEELEKAILDKLPSLLEGVCVVAISDYGKGFLSRNLLTVLIQLAKEKGISVIADPKGVDFSKYNGATVIKPNLGEAYAAANLTPDSPLELASKRLLQITGAEILMVTRSEAGISVFHRDGERQDFPVRVREVKDVTGAGDTVLATLTCAVANELPFPTAVQLSNVTAGMAIERFGCARITLSELARRLLEEDTGNKVFDEDHLYALKEALKGQKYALLSVSSRDGMNSAMFSAIRQVAKSGRDLLLFVRDAHPDEDFVSLLASLHEVNFILLKSENVKMLCDAIHPEEMYSLDDGKLHAISTIK